MREAAWCLVALAALVVPAAAQGVDWEFTLKDGRVLVGTIGMKSGSTLFIRLDDGGTVMVKESDIVSRKPLDDREPRRPAGKAPSSAPPAGPKPGGPAAPAPPLGEGDHFRPGCLKPSAGQRPPVDLLALTAFPEAFLGGAYQAYARVDGPAPMVAEWFKDEVSIKVGFMAYGWDRPDAGRIAFVWPRAREAELAGWKGKGWVKLSFTLSRRTYENPSRGKTVFYAASVSAIEAAGPFEDAGQTKRQPTAWQGRELWTWMEPLELLVPAPEGEPPIFLAHLSFTRARLAVGCYLGGIEPARVAELARHPAPMPARIRIEKASLKLKYEAARWDYTLARVVEMTRLYPWSDGAAALVYCRFKPEGIVFLASERISGHEAKSIGPQVLSSVGGHDFFPGMDYDRREWRQVSRVAGQDHTGRLVVSSSGPEGQPGFFVPTPQGLVEHPSREAVKALSPRPREIWQRVMHVIGRSTGPGFVTRGPVTIPSSVTAVQLAPYYQRLIWSEEKGDWVPRDRKATYERVKALIEEMKTIPEQAEQAHYRGRDVEGKLTSARSRLEWLDRMLARPNNSPQGQADLARQRDAKRAELKRLESEQRAAQADRARLASKLARIKEELCAYWSGEKG